MLTVAVVQLLHCVNPVNITQRSWVRQRLPFICHWALHLFVVRKCLVTFSWHNCKHSLTVYGSIFTHVYLWSWGTEPRNLLCVCISEQSVWETRIAGHGDWTTTTAPHVVVFVMTFKCIAIFWHASCMQYCTRRLLWCQSVPTYTLSSEMGQRRVIQELTQN